MQDRIYHIFRFVDQGTILFEDHPTEVLSKDFFVEELDTRSITDREERNALLRKTINNVFKTLFPAQFLNKSCMAGTICKFKTFIMKTLDMLDGKGTLVQ